MRVTDRGLRDGAAHRASLPVVYNQYSKVSSDASSDPESEAVVSLFRPLFTTSFFIDDMLGEDRFVRAERVAISSASSKTGFALAFCLHRRGVPTIGLTSPSNVDFVSGLGWYDDVVTYDDIDKLGDGGPLVYVDMSGNASVRFAVHSCAAELVASVAVGITHWDASTPAGSLPGPTPEMFFAPTQITKRIEEWGQAVVDQRVGASWDEFVAEVDELVSVARVEGADGATSAYLAALDGSADPSVGVIVEP